MMLTFSVKITEGIIYDAIKGAVNECLPALARQIAGADKPADLSTASGFTILRNGKPITDDQIGKFRDKPLTRSVKYSAVVTVGGVTATIVI